MPKDATKNVDRYKIRGGQLNEFDFNQNQEEFAERGTKVTQPTKGTKTTKANKGASAKKRAAPKTKKK
jgi:hypothetical protein